MTKDNSMTVPSAVDAGAVDGAATQRFVTCAIDGEMYAVPVQSVREVVRWMPVTRIPHGAPSVKGVINLRGEIVPLIDLRIHLGLPETTPSDRTCIIVISMQRDGAKLQAGLIVDAALEVIRVATSEIEGGHDALPGKSGRHLTGIVQAKGALIILLACESLVRDALFPATIETAA